MIFQEMLSGLDRFKFNKMLKKWNVPKDEQDEYVSFIDKMLALKPIECNGELTAENFKGEITVGVSENERSFAIDFIPWDEVISYKVNPEEITNVLSIEEFCFHVLYDMTFDGFHQETRDESVNKLINRIKDAPDE